MRLRIAATFSALDERLKRRYRGHPFDYFQTRILAVMTGLAMVIIMMISLAFFLVPGSAIAPGTGKLFGPLLLGLSLVFGLSCFWLLSGEVVLAKTIIGIASLVAIIGTLAMTGGFPASRVSFIVLLQPIFFYCLYGARPGLLVSLLMPIIAGGMWIARDQFHIVFPDHFSYTNTEFSTTMAIIPIYAITVFIVAVYENANRQLSLMLDNERRLQAQLAFRDPLTGLDNSRAFAEQLRMAVSSRDCALSSLSVIYCDIDDLKPINDARGHMSGDQVLITVGQRLRSAVRSQFDLVARMGGDEFAILLPGCPETEIETIVRRIRAQMSEPIRLNDQTITVHVSIGVATGLPGETDPSEIVKRADAAMYRNKAEGKQSRLSLREERANP